MKFRATYVGKLKNQILVFIIGNVQLFFLCLVLLCILADHVNEKST